MIRPHDDLRPEAGKDSLFDNRVIHQRALCCFARLDLSSLQTASRSCGYTADEKENIPPKLEIAPGAL